MTRFVHDSFSLLAHFRDEPGAARVRQLIAARGNEHWMTFINLGEVYYKTAKEYGIARANDVFDSAMDLPISFVEADAELTMTSARVKARYAMSYADCFAVVLAQQLDASVVTGDPEFEPLEQAGIVSIEWLTPKTKRRSR